VEGKKNKVDNEKKVLESPRGSKKGFDAVVE
jgi:hypothetical protein